MPTTGERIIAIDTEYHTNYMGRIDKVFCLCAQDITGKPFKKWTSNLSIDETKSILEELSAFYNIEEPIFLCHAFDLAERRALKFMGVDNSKYKFIDTCFLAKMLQNTFDKNSERVKLKTMIGLSDEERTARSIALKEKSNNDASYVGLCKRFKLALIDTEHKEAMRKLCIMNKTEGHEQEILDYCCEDTQFLIPIFKNLFKEYYTLLRNSFCPMNPGKFNNIGPEVAIKCLCSQTNSINDFGDIADKGIPLNKERVEKIKANSRNVRKQLQEELNEKYPGIFTEFNEADNRYKENTKATQHYLMKNLKEMNITNYPRSKSGARLCTDSETLENYFEHQDCFGEHYRQYAKLTNKLKSVAKADDNPFNYYENGNLWYGSLEPYGTITSRCAPSTKRFIFGWHKSLYGLMEPRPGKWLVELDFGSEETFCQACICKDTTYNDIYQSKDIYLKIATLMGKLPASEFDKLPTSELKSKYKSVRSLVKPMVLGLSYGMGYQKLSDRCGISRIEAKKDVANINNRVLKDSTKYKENIKFKARETKAKAFSLPDGFLCKYNEHDANVTTVKNWPFQSSGGVILRYLVHVIMTAIRQHKLNTTILATIHDAIFFEVDEGDYDTIKTIAEIMRKSANAALHAPEGWTMKVGEPDIIKHGDIWTPDPEFTKQFEKILNFEDK